MGAVERKDRGIWSGKFYLSREDHLEDVDGGEELQPRFRRTRLPESGDPHELIRHKQAAKIAERSRAGRPYRGERCHGGWVADGVAGGDGEVRVGGLKRGPDGVQKERLGQDSHDTFELLWRDDAADGETGGQAEAEFIREGGLRFPAEQERAGADRTLGMLEFQRGLVMAKGALATDDLRHDSC